MEAALAAPDSYQRAPCGRSYACLEAAAQGLEIAGTAPYSHTVQSDRTELASEQAAQNHRILARKWETLLNDVRLTPGFENFLRPKTISQLACVAGSGAVVVVNVWETRAHALILRPFSTDILHVQLPSLTQDKISVAYNQLAKALHRRGFRQMEARALVYLNQSCLCCG